MDFTFAATGLTLGGLSLTSYALRQYYVHAFYSLKDIPLFDINHIKDLNILKKKRIMGLRLKMPLTAQIQKNIDLNFLDPIFFDFNIYNDILKSNIDTRQNLIKSPNFFVDNFEVSTNDEINIKIELNNVLMIHNCLSQKKSKQNLFISDFQGKLRKDKNYLMIGNFNKKGIFSPKYITRENQEGILIAVDKKAFKLLNKCRIFLGVAFASQILFLGLKN